MCGSNEIPLNEECRNEWWFANDVARCTVHSIGFEHSQPTNRLSRSLENTEYTSSEYRVQNHSAYTYIYEYVSSYCMMAICRRYSSNASCIYSIQLNYLLIDVCIVKQNRAMLPSHFPHIKRQNFTAYYKAFVYRCRNTIAYAYAEYRRISLQQISLVYLAQNEYQAKNVWCEQ